MTSNGTQVVATTVSSSIDSNTAKTNSINGNHNTNHHSYMEPDLVMMTPLKKELDHTILRVERIDKDQLDFQQQNARHVAGGQHQGIIVNKQLAQDGSKLRGRQFDLRLSFKVFLVNAITQIHQQESRELRFWFDPSGASNNSKDQDRLQCAQSFFRALVNPVDFPKNYVGFIMKLMKTMQQPIYRPLIQIELEVKQIDEPFERPLFSSSGRSCKMISLLNVENHKRNIEPPEEYKDDKKELNKRPSGSNVHALPDLFTNQTINKSSANIEIVMKPPIPPKPKRLAIMTADNSKKILSKSAVDMASANHQLLTEDKVLEMIESAYPNPLSLPDIAATTCSNEEDVRRLVRELCSKGVARLTDLGQVIRVTSDEQQVKRVSQMPKVVRSQQPTIAIITAQFCEKLAVDAMIENKDTYVRYKGEGESNVYTLGNIGPHRVVATKLPAVGNTRSAMIAAGNTTTRLLGTFQHVEYVFLVGIGGGVPHYTDYEQHVRLGDVVVSTSPRRNFQHLSNGQNGHNSHNNHSDGQASSHPSTRSDFIYVHCEKLRSSPDEPMNSSNSTWKELQTVDSFNYRFWCPLSLELQDIARQIYIESQEDCSLSPSWERYLDEARHKLQKSDDLEFVRPNTSTDKLYMSIGTNDVIEMAHPEPDESTVIDSLAESDPRKRGMPKIHFGAVGSGRLAVGNEQLRQDIALKFGIKAFDIEFDTVIESIFGNRKDRYIIIRGIADYKDGSRKKEWQPYAALSAAAYMKAILCRLEPLV